jgi:hypothetical protein
VTTEAEFDAITSTRRRPPTRRRDSPRTRSPASSRRPPELAEHRGRAPDLVVADRDAARRSRRPRGRGGRRAASPDRRRISSTDPRGDCRCRHEHRCGVGQRDNRLDREAADGDVDGREPARDGEAGTSTPIASTASRFIVFGVSPAPGPRERDLIGVVGDRPCAVSTTCGTSSRGNSRISTAAGRSRQVGRQRSVEAAATGGRGSAAGQQPGQRRRQVRGGSGRRRSGSLTSRARRRRGPPPA